MKHKVRLSKPRRFNLKRAFFLLAIALYGLYAYFFTTSSSIRGASGLPASHSLSFPLYFSSFADNLHHSKSSTSSITTKGSANQKEEEECPAPTTVASQLFSHWSDKISGSWLSLQKPAMDDRTTTAYDKLLELGLVVSSDICIARFIFDGRQVHMLDTFEHHCNATGLAESSRSRGELYANIMTHLITSRETNADSWQPFSWYMDLTSGHRHNKELTAALGNPILAAASSPEDFETLLVPDAYMLSALLSGSRLEHLLPKSLRQFAAGLVEKYTPSSYEYSDAAGWKERKPAAVFRGHCHPTIDADNPKPHSRVMVRSSLCKAYATYNDTSIDIGTFNQGSHSPCANSDEIKKYDFCQGCALCSQKQHLSQAEMLEYKYQLAVDGHGPAYDGNVWKLLSYSTVVFLHEDSINHLHWQMFYYPYLQSGTHYYTASVSELNGIVEFCQAHDEDCEMMAAAARAAMTCLLDLEMVLDYMKRTLELLHDWHSGRF